jgi:hypothetical protein
MFILISTTAKSFLFYVRYSILLHLSPLRFHYVGGCWDRTQDSKRMGPPYTLYIHVHCSDL